MNAVGNNMVTLEQRDAMYGAVEIEAWKVFVAVPSKWKGENHRMTFLLGFLEQPFEPASIQHQRSYV